MELSLSIPDAHVLRSRLRYGDEDGNIAAAFDQRMIDKLDAAIDEAARRRGR